MASQYNFDRLGNPWGTRYVLVDGYRFGKTWVPVDNVIGQRHRDIGKTPEQIAYERAQWKSPYDYHPDGDLSIIPGSEMTTQMPVGYAPTPAPTSSAPNSIPTRQPITSGRGTSNRQVQQGLRGAPGEQLTPERRAEIRNARREAAQGQRTTVPLGRRTTGVNTGGGTPVGGTPGGGGGTLGGGGGTSPSTPSPSRGSITPSRGSMRSGFCEYV